MFSYQHKVVMDIVLMNPSMANENAGLLPRATREDVYCACTLHFHGSMENRLSFYR